MIRRRRTVLRIAVIGLALLPAGCGGSGDAGGQRTASTSPASSDGRPPRRIIRMQVRADRVTTLRLRGGGHEATVALASYNPSGDYPQTAMRSVDIRIRSVAATGVPTRRLASLLDTGGTGTLTTGGDLRDLTWATPEALPVAARRELRLIEARLLALAVPLPRRPIGIGARWTVDRPGGPTTYEVTGRTSTELTYTARQGDRRRTGRVRLDRPLSTAVGTDFTATRVTSG